MIYTYDIKHESYSQVQVDSEMCVHCKYCADSCKEGVLALNRRLRVVEVVNPDNCNSCNLCACPYGAREFLPRNEVVDNLAFGLIGTQVYSR